MREQLTDLIVKRFQESRERLKKQFFSKHPLKVARHFTLDNLLPKEIAERAYAEFPNPKKMGTLSNFGEIKLKHMHINNTSQFLQDLHYAIQNPRVVAEVEHITEIKKQIPDTSRLAGGVSIMKKGYFINPHLDNSHDVDKKFYRAVNVLYYVSPDWKLENGGNFEVWDEEVKNRIIVPSYFNRLLVMETNRKSWHSVNPVLCNQPRCCVFNYYFSEESPEGEEYYHGTSLFSLVNPLFKARPEQKIRRALGYLKDAILGKK